jgi:hypothetical protein
MLFIIYFLKESFVWLIISCKLKLQNKYFLCNFLPQEVTVTLTPEISVHRILGHAAPVRAERVDPGRPVLVDEDREAHGEHDADCLIAGLDVIRLVTEVRGLDPLHPLGDDVLVAEVINHRVDPHGALLAVRKVSLRSNSACVSRSSRGRGRLW